MNPLYEQMQTSVFERMSLAAAKNGAVNLGQGFPDFGWPDEILDAAGRALKERSNQYAPSRGLPVLRQAVADHYRRHFGQELAAEQVCITSGATEALGAAILATIEPGDEVIIFTPAYDSYAPMIRRGGGVPVEVALRPPAWRIDRDELGSAVTDRTRVIMLNNPHNPAGKLFGREELEAVAAVARDRDLIVISDEVWEHVLLDGRRFTPIGSLPGMAERTIKIGSAGKIFSLTGWKVGWMIASPELADVLARAHQFLTFSTAPNLQAAVAFGLNDGDSWLEPMRARFQRSRDRLTAGLREVGYAVLDSAATYFLCVDLKASGIGADDEAFAREAVDRAGVAVIPLSAFAERDPVRHLVRLCFGKKDETIDAGIAAMAKAKELFA
jgi:aspartate/methionine/tyrosine aminotransferase